MRAGPSPLIPLLLVGALGWFIYSSDIMEGLSFISEVQESPLALLLILPAALLLMVHFASEIIVVPIMFLIMVFVLNNILIGPLVLLLVIHLLGKYHRTSEESGPCGEQTRRSSGDEGEGFGLGSFMLVMLFLISYSVFYEGEGYGLITLATVVAIFLFFNMF